jgi:hypothetical protein
MADITSPFTPSMQAQIAQLLQGQIDRSNQSNPVHQAAMAMAMRMAPGYAQSAVTAPSAAPAGGSLTPSVSSGGIGPGLGTTATTLAFAALLKNPAFLSAIKNALGLGSAWGPDGTFVGKSTVTGADGSSPLNAGGPSSGPVGGPSPMGGPNTVGTPFDISNQGGRNDVRAVGTDQIQQLIRLMGGNPAGSGSPYDGLGNGGPGAI